VPSLKILRINPTIILTEENAKKLREFCEMKGYDFESSWIIVLNEILSDYLSKSSTNRSFEVLGLVKSSESGEK